MSTTLSDLADRTAATLARIDRLIRLNEPEEGPVAREISPAEEAAMEELHGAMCETDR